MHAIYRNSELRAPLSQLKRTSTTRDHEQHGLQLTLGISRAALVGRGLLLVVGSHFRIRVYSGPCPRFEHKTHLQTSEVPLPSVLG